jgi:hypothetical protein
VSSGIKLQFFSDDVREMLRESKAWAASRSFQRNNIRLEGEHWKARLFRAGAYNITAARF